MKHIKDGQIEQIHNQAEPTPNNISIYINASDGAPEQKENENRINLKNRTKEAKDMLIRNGFKEEEADTYLKSAYDIIEDSQLLRNLWGGLALFLNQHYFNTINFNWFIQASRKHE